LLRLSAASRDPFGSGVSKRSVENGRLPTLAARGGCG
jgi:hypothetical protein